MRRNVPAALHALLSRTVEGGSEDAVGTAIGAVAEERPSGCDGGAHGKCGGGSVVVIAAAAHGGPAGGVAAAVEIGRGAKPREC